MRPDSENLSKLSSRRFVACRKWSQIQDHYRLKCIPKRSQSTFFILQWPGEIPLLWGKGETNTAHLDQRTKQWWRTRLPIRQQKRCKSCNRRFVDNRKWISVQDCYYRLNYFPTSELHSSVASNSRGETLGRSRPLNSHRDQRIIDVIARLNITRLAPK